MASPELALKLEWELHTDNFGSDHFPIKIINSCSDTPPTHYWKLKTANWDGYQAGVNLPNMNLFLSATQACGLVEQSFLDAGNAFVGKSSGISKNKITKCWWNDKCAQAVKSKRRAYSLFCKHPENIHNLIYFKKAQAKSRQIILTSRMNSWMNFVSTITSQTTSTTIWRKIQAIQHKRTR